MVVQRTSQNTAAQKLKAANRRINALQQKEKSLNSALARTGKGGGRRTGAPPSRPAPARPPARQHPSKAAASGWAKVRGAVANKSLFNAFARNACNAVPTSLSSGTSVCQRFRYCAIKRMGKLEPVDATATGDKTYHGGRNALIFHPYNNVALYQTDEGGTSTLSGTSATAGLNACPIGNFGLFHRMSDSSTTTGVKQVQVSTLEKNIPKEIQVQRFSIRIRNITCLRDLDGGVYVLRLPTLSTLYKTWRHSTGTNTSEYFVACHGEEAPGSGIAAGNTPAGQGSEIPASYLKKYVRTHNDTRFYTAAELVAAKQINIHVTDAMAYESWHQLVNAVKDPAHPTSTTIMGEALKEALSLTSAGSALDVADDTESGGTAETPGKWCDGGWMASATGTVAKFGGGGSGTWDGPIGATMTPSGMGVVVMIFESTRMQEYEVTCEMTCKARYASSNILSQQHVAQPTAPIGMLNALRDREEAKGSTLNTLASEGENMVARSGVAQRLENTAVTDVGHALESLTLG